MADGGEEGEEGIAVQGVSSVPSWDGGKKEEGGTCILECGLAAGRFQEAFRLFMPGRMGSLCFSVSEKQIGVAKQSTGWKTSWMKSPDLIPGVIELET